MYENDFCEYAVVKKKEGAYIAKIILCAALALAVSAVSIALLLFKGVIGFIPLALVCAAVWYLSRFLTIEYEYSLSGEYMDFAAVYSKQYRKELLSVELKKSARRAMPYTDNKIDGFNIEKVYDLRSSRNAENAYILIYDDGNGEKAVLFDATKRIVENMFRQIPSLVVRSNNLPE